MMKKNLFCISVYDPYHSLPYPSQTVINDLIDRILRLLQQENCHDIYHIGEMFSPLSEYLESNPDKARVVEQIAAQKKIFFGPFFIQPDLGPVSGELLIRNLLIGHQKGRQIGDILKTGYLPIMYDRNSQVPQILAGFNIDAVLIDYDFHLTDKKTGEFMWEGPDGSKLLVGRAAFLNSDVLADSKARMDDLLERFDNNSSDYIFIYQFNDIIGLENLPVCIEKLSSYFKTEIQIGSLSECIWNIKDIVDLKEISQYKGEICFENAAQNDKNQYDYFLRQSIEVSIVNHRLLNLLQYIIEPWFTIANILKLNPVPVPIEKLWIQLLKNQAFTNLSNDQPDQFIRNLYNELTVWVDQSEKYLEGIIELIVNKIHISDSPTKYYYFTIINPLPYSRSEIAEIILEMPLMINRDTIVAREIGGREIPFRIMSKEEGGLFQLDDRDKAHYRCLADLKNIPGMGWKTYQIELSGRPKLFPAVPISSERNSLENDYLRVEIKANGTLDIFAKETGEFFSEIGYFQDEIDLGQYGVTDKTATHIPLTTKKMHPQIKLIHNTPEYADYKIEYFWEIPKSFIWSHFRRSPKHERITITEIVSLDRLSRQIDLKVEIHDHAYDHQIKICFPIDFIPENTYTDGLFSIEQRPFDVPKNEHTKSLSMRNFVGVSNEEGGFAILSNGIHEYQISKGKHNLLALPLIRNFQISRTDKTLEEEKPRNEKLNIHLGFYPHLANWESDEILTEALMFNTPLIVRQLEKTDGYLPSKLQFLKVSPDIILFSTFKPADENNSVIVRLYNPTRNTLDGEIESCLPIKAARCLTLEEHIITSIESTDSYRLNIKIYPKKIATIKIYFNNEYDIQDIV